MKYTICQLLDIGMIHFKKSMPLFRICFAFFLNFYYFIHIYSIVHNSNIIIKQ